MTNSINAGGKQGMGAWQPEAQSGEIEQLMAELKAARFAADRDAALYRAAEYENERLKDELRRMTLNRDYHDAAHKGISVILNGWANYGHNGYKHARVVIHENNKIRQRNERLTRERDEARAEALMHERGKECLLQELDRKQAQILRLEEENGRLREAMEEIRDYVNGVSGELTYDIYVIADAALTTTDTGQGGDTDNGVTAKPGYMGDYGGRPFGPVDI